MVEEVTLETLDAKLDLIIDNTGSIIDILENTDTIIGILNAQTTTINSILDKVNNINSSSQSSEPVSEVTSEFKAELQAKIDEGLPYNQVKQWIIEKLYVLGIYSEEDINIKLFTHKTGDLILEIKTRPHPYFGKVLDFFQQSLGDADYFETSRYEMRVIQWWRLTKNMQMSEQTSDSSIIDKVTDEWGDLDDVNNNG